MVDSPTRSKALGAALWIIALVIMVAAGRYQRMTGPTYPVSGSATIGEAVIDYEFVRSETTDQDATVGLRRVVPSLAANLSYRRYGTDDQWITLPMTISGDSLVGRLPRQPAAGKLEYFLDVSAGNAIGQIGREEPVVIRFKGPVPLPILLAHVLAMFVAMMVAVRAALEVMVNASGGKRLAIVALALMTIGGLILGPIVQKYAFGEYWTGFPWGYDLTDNKTLLMWVAWAVAVGSYFTTNATWVRARRFVVVGAAIVMLVVYLIPHSLGGSELDYEKVDQGVDPSEAIGTGD